TVSFATFYIPILWTLVLTLNPLDQLARRLVLLSIGVLILAGWNELSTFDIHRFVDTMPKYNPHAVMRACVLSGAAASGLHPDAVAVSGVHEVANFGVRGGGVHL